LEKLQIDREGDRKKGSLKGHNLVNENLRKKRRLRGLALESFPLKKRILSSALSYAYTKVLATSWEKEVGPS